MESALLAVSSYDKSQSPIPQCFLSKLAKDPKPENSKILGKAKKLANYIDLYSYQLDKTFIFLYGQEKGD